MQRAKNIAKIWQRLAPPLGGWGVILLILLSALPRYAHAQMGGPSQPITLSTHTYTVNMFNGSNTVTWYIFEDGTNINNVDPDDYIYLLGEGTKDAGVASVQITFTAALYTVGTTYVLGYREMEPSGLSCLNYRFYDITIQPEFNIDIDTTGGSFPADICPVEPISFRTDLTPTLSDITHQSVYYVELLAPDGYGYDWTFSFALLTLAQRTGYDNADITDVTISGAGMSDIVYNSINAPTFEATVSSIPNGTTTVTVTVGYAFVPGSQHDIEFEISALRGSFLEVDSNDPQSEEHIIYRIPAPSALSAVD
jgi:hypothetical protein